jgi:hypothetical protein
VGGRRAPFIPNTVWSLRQGSHSHPYAKP